MSKTFRALTVLALFGLLAAGCTVAERAGDPLTPDVEFRTGNENGVTNHSLWLYEEIYIDPETLEYEILPTRIPDGHWNILSWLEEGPCTDCFSIVSLTPGPGTLLADIEISHPFPNANFTGFDVRGIVMFNGSVDFTESGLMASDATLGDGQLINADGFTTLFNSTTEGSGPLGFEGYLKGKFASPIAPDATLNGYKRHISDDPTNTRNAFLAGDAVTVTYEIDMPNGPFILGYAVDASWAKPLTKPVTDPMVDFGPDANCQEPWKVVITQMPEGDGLTDLGGQVKLMVDIYSHLPGPFDVSVEAPGLFDGINTENEVEDTQPGYVTYEIQVENENMVGPGLYNCLISVQNQDNPDVPDWIDLTAYQIETLQVISSTPMDPVALATALPNPQASNAPVSFNDNGSYDPDGGVLALFEWDFDNDGTYDATGVSVQHSYASVGNYQAQLRVTDDEGATGVLAVPLNIVIEDLSTPPVAIAMASPNPQQVDTPVNFNDNGSNDPDGGAIVLFEWDFENDGTYDATGASVQHSYATPGLYSVQLRVTDDEGATDTLNSPLQVTIQSGAVPPVAAASVNPNPQTVNLPVSFNDNGSYDPDGGAIALFEWDFDNDGTYDDTGASVQHTYTSPGLYQVQLRVTDDEGAKDTLDSPIQLTINGATVPPVAIAMASPNPQTVGLNVTFSDNGSNDPDGGSITLYEWDWNNDGTYDATGASVNHAFSAVGTHFVQFRVTDDEAQTDTLDAPLLIVIEASQSVTWDNTIQSMLAGSCSGCHVGGGSSGGVKLDTYADLVASDVMTPGNPDSSIIYNTIKNNNHFGQLSPSNLTTFYDWILAGAIEN